jgi:hypothetical protein
MGTAPAVAEVESRIGSLRNDALWGWVDARRPSHSKKAGRRGDWRSGRPVRQEEATRIVIQAGRSEFGGANIYDRADFPRTDG